MTVMADHSAAAREVVRSADRMDRATFIKHMNYRHADSMKNWVLTDIHMTAAMEELWRKFHAVLHRIRPDISHEHGRP